jgi:hypothetical protein
MAHYALLDSDNVVIGVVTGVDETETAPTGFSDWEDFYLDFHTKLDSNVVDCKRTSYNTWKGVHSDSNKTAFRGNFAGIGGTYDSVNDGFVPVDPSYFGRTYTWNVSNWAWELDD